MIARLIARLNARLIVVPAILAVLGCSESRTSAPRLEPQRPTQERVSPEPPAQTRWSFQLDQVEVQVLDLGPDPLHLPEGALLAINGGFFDRDFEAEGYVVSKGEVISEWDVDIGGGVITGRDGRAEQHDGEVFVTPRDPPEWAIQAKPRLVVNGALNIRSDTGLRAARTALCLKNEGRELMVAVIPAEESEGPTLYELGQQLVREGCEEALNLDGGPSTGFVAPDRASMPRGPIRHAVVIRPANVP